MADLKASAMIAWLKTHLGDGYVYGTVGQICTAELLQAKQRQYGAAMGEGYYQAKGDYTKGKCARWLGRWVADCSGLIKAGRRDLTGVFKDVSAQGTYDQCSRRGKVATMPLVPGCTLYMWSSSKNRMGHVGMYIGEGWVIESRGVGEGVVKSKLSSRTWGYWGLLDWLEPDLPAENGAVIPGGEADAGDNTGPKPDDPTETGVPPTLAQGSKGNTTKYLQQWLNLHGASPRLAEDGAFGPKTAAAVSMYNQTVGLPQDGVASSHTWAGLIAPPPAVALTLSNVRKGNSGIQPMLAQRLLFLSGITPWAVNGAFDANAQTAAKVFQKARGLAADGVVGPKTWTELLKLQKTVPVTVQRGGKGPEVVLLQLLLAAGSYSPGPADGVFGPQTETALKAFQTAKGLSANGVAGPETWAKLLG